MRILLDEPDGKATEWRHKGRYKAQKKTQPRRIAPNKNI